MVTDLDGLDWYAKLEDEKEGSSGYIMLSMSFSPSVLTARSAILSLA